MVFEAGIGCYPVILDESLDLVFSLPLCIGEACVRGQNGKALCTGGHVHMRRPDLLSLLSPKQINKSYCVCNLKGQELPLQQAFLSVLIRKKIGEEEHRWQETFWQHLLMHD
jgi:hypothetical protein